MNGASDSGSIRVTPAERCGSEVTEGSSRGPARHSLSGPHTQEQAQIRPGATGLKPGLKKYVSYTASRINAEWSGKKSLRFMKAITCNLQLGMLFFSERSELWRDFLA